jgi:DNA-binding NtrC family response regulator
MILLLDSEPFVRSIMKEVLEQAGHVVVATGGLGVAVKRLTEGKIDLLIIRPYVDNITGYEAAKYLRARNPRMEVLLIGGLLDDHRLRDRAAIERFEVFPKPFTAAELLEKVAEVLKTAQDRAARA